MLQMAILLSNLCQCWQVRYALDAFFHGASNEPKPTIQFDVEETLW